MREAVNAVRLRADWRPLLGLRQQDVGTFVDRLLSRVVVGLAVEAHNEDVAKANRDMKKG